MSEEPIDPIAERMVLAITLHSPDQAGAAFAALPPGSWTDERHSLLAAVLADRYAREAPIEPCGVVRDCVDRAGTDAAAHRMGRFVTDLMGSAMPAEALGYYAERVASLASVRRLHVEAQRFTQRVLGAAAVDDDESFRRSVMTMRDACDDALVSFKAQPKEPPMSAAELLTGSDEYDWLVPGLLERTDRVIITGPEGLGKALALDTPVPTPKGWATMGALSVGDEVFSPNGASTRVVAATEVMHGRPCYRITFSDGAQITADEQHLWLTETLRARERTAQDARRGPLKPHGTDQRHKRKHFPAVATTREIAETLWARNGHVLNHSVQTCSPLQYPAQELLVDPYLLGVWLGDGTSATGGVTLNRDDAEHIEHRITAAGWPVRRVPSGDRPSCVLTTVPGLLVSLRALGVLGNKHIPASYLHASVPQRLALLQGLMDTDGSMVGTVGRGRGTGVICEFSVCSERLGRDVHELLLGLGIKVTWRQGPAKLNGRVVGTRYRLSFQSELAVASLPRKAAKIHPLRTRRAKLRYITAVEPIDSVPVRCIQVENPDGMFVVGRECVPTHNSVVAGQMAATIAAGVHPFTAELLPRRFSGYRVLVVDCENSRRQLRRRFRKLLGQVDAVCVSHGMDLPDWSQILRFVIRPEGISLTEPRELARIEQAVAATAPDLLVIGPMYRLSKVDVRDEQAAKELTDTIDLLRVRHNLTVLIETHAGHGQNGSGSRQLRPLGSSLFLRWPEFGYGLRPHESAAHMEHPSMVEVTAWRGSRDERHWPRTLRHGQRLPWEPADPDYFRETPVWRAA